MASGLEVAEVFRRHGEANRQAHAAHLGRVERRVMGAIETCRTAALGGHVEHCADRGLVRIAYNSCLMGRSSNGESAWQCRHFSVNSGSSCLHNGALLRPRQLGHRWPVTNGGEYVGDLLPGSEDVGTPAERAKRAVPRRLRSGARTAGL